jgi:hypothetical protein
MDDLGNVKEIGSRRSSAEPFVTDLHLFCVPSGSSGGGDDDLLSGFLPYRFCRLRFRIFLSFSSCFLFRKWSQDSIKAVRS